MVEFIVTHMMKNFPLDLYKWVAITIFLNVFGIWSMISKIYSLSQFDESLHYGSAILKIAVVIHVWCN